VDMQNETNTTGKWIIIDGAGQVLSEIKPSSLLLKWLEVGEETKPEPNGNRVKRIA
jgi:hypothetical protein